MLSSGGARVRDLRAQAEEPDMGFLAESADKLQEKVRVAVAQIASLEKTLRDATGDESFFHFKNSFSTCSPRPFSPSSRRPILRLATSWPVPAPLLPASATSMASGGASPRSRKSRRLHSSASYALQHGE